MSLSRRSFASSCSLSWEPSEGLRCVVCCVCVWCVCVSAHVCVNFLWCVMLLKSWCVMLACVWFDPVRGLHTFPCPLGQPTLTNALQVCTGWRCFPNWLVFLGFPLTHSTERWCGQCGVWCVVCVCTHALYVGVTSSQTGLCFWVSL